ncbi:hypothetical protein BGZ70_008389 [Mortierella alpina]|uniref:Alpha-N-acetylglucosaminidase n=1 Tax=Mortierella alpina TaxID=64518 RepID=A0A9P6M7B5_MORAP|nr:hypothetical protein BGZ70_008389 [Mortierella alpina]
MGSAQAPPPWGHKKPRSRVSMLWVATAAVCCISSLLGTSQVVASPIAISPHSPSCREAQNAEWSATTATSDPSARTVYKRSVAQPGDAVSLLVRRLLPAAYHNHFQFALKPDLASGSASNIYDAFRISNGDSGKVIVEGVTASALGAGLNHYLKHVCQVELAWSGDRFTDLPTVPPTIPQDAGAGGEIRASFVPWRYYTNVVTFGYSFAFWDWTRWEREIGQEYVFRQFYENQGLSRESLNGFLSGPAFMPWQRMGNLQGSWGFPNDTQFKNDWIDSQWELQIQIMQRMQDFGITPIMPSFNGFVPRDLVSKYPTTKFENASMWALIPDPYSRVTFVPSTEPLFGTLSQQFIQLQNSMYEARGVKLEAPRNFYLLDLFNELNPNCMRVDCLQQITSGVMKALKAADPKAVWVMQAWFLLHRDIWKEAETKAFFDGIRETNEGRDAFVIDLYSDVAPLWESTQGFFGIDWGWSMLNNFGGGQGLYGTLPALLTEPFRGYQQPAKTMRGMGITMEGINNNEYLYQLILDLPWQDAVVNNPSSTPNGSSLQITQASLNGQQHLESFISRRYGPNQTSQAMLDVWTTLSQTVWDCRTQQMSQSKSLLDNTPAVDMRREGFMTNIFWYDQKKVVQAWGQFVQSTETEASRKRRGRRSAIQSSIEHVLRATGGYPEPETQVPSDCGDGQRKLTTSKNRLWSSLSKLVQDALQDTVSQGYEANSVSSTATSSTPLKRTIAKAVTVSPTILAANPPTSTLCTKADLPLNVSSFRYDLVDVTREVLTAVVLPGLHAELIEAYKAKDVARTRSTGNMVLDTIRDIDRILSTHSHFMLGPWIRDARVSAKVISSQSPKANAANKSYSETEMESYADYLENNARNQVTWWGPGGQQSLADYASKQWAGLVKEFYLPRWQIFVDRLVTAAEKRTTLDYKAYLQDVLAVESKWQKETTCLGGECQQTSGKASDKYPVEAVEDTALVAQDLWDRWGQAAMRLAQKASK